MTLKRWLGAGLLLAAAAVLTYLGVGISGFVLYYDHPDNAALAAGKGVLIALAPLFFAACLVAGAVALSKQNKVILVLGGVVLVLGVMASAWYGAVSVRPYG